MRRQKPSMLIVEVPHAITPSNTRIFEHAVCVQRVCLRCKIHQGKNHEIIYSNLSRKTSRKSTYLY